MTALLDTLHIGSLADTVLIYESAACSARSSHCIRQTADAVHLSAAYYCPTQYCGNAMACPADGDHDLKLRL